MFDPSKHEGSLTHLEDFLTRLGDTMHSLTLKMDKLLHRVSPVTLVSVATLAQAHHHQPFFLATNHKMKLEVPRFDGTKPLGWIFKINQYFEYHNTPDKDRLTIASFYMEGRALAWFQYMTNNAQFTSWATLLQALQTRFVPSQYDDPTRTLFKLTQTGTFVEYMSEFEDLANRIIGLSPPFLLAYFISGLSPEIRREVQAY